MEWTAIVVALISAGVAIFTAWQGDRAKRRAERAEANARSIEQQKVDQAAFKEAQQSYRLIISQLRESNERLEREMQTLRRMAEEDRANLVKQLKQAHQERSIMESYLRGRIAKLEAALRDSGIPIPDDHLPGSI